MSEVRARKTHAVSSQGVVQGSNVGVELDVSASRSVLHSLGVFKEKIRQVWTFGYFRALTLSARRLTFESFRNPYSSYRSSCIGGH